MGSANSSEAHGFWLCPLYSFDCYSESVELAEGIQLQRITTELASYLRERYPDCDGVGIADYMIILPHGTAVSDNKVSFLTEFTDKSELLADVISAFRLCHAGGVTPGPLLFTRPSVFEAISLHISKSEIDFISAGLLEYEFYPSDVPKVNKLIREIRTCHEPHKFSPLDETLRRFNSAYYGEPEDRLIDQMIAFESLYIGDNKELGYKLALRTAFLLGRERKQIFGGMKKAYALRGQIVHGNKQVEMTKLEETIPKTEEYLRQSIRRFLLLLSKGMSLQEIQDKLDENILKNGKPLALKE